MGSGCIVAYIFTLLTIMHIFTCQKFCISPVKKSMKITHYRTSNLSRCDRILRESKGALSVNLVRSRSN